jgi:hypothetical protein
MPGTGSASTEYPVDGSEEVIISHWTKVLGVSDIELTWNWTMLLNQCLTIFRSGAGYELCLTLI